MRSVQLHIFSHFGGLITEVSLQFFPPCYQRRQKWVPWRRCQVWDQWFLILILLLSFFSSAMATPTEAICYCQWKENGTSGATFSLTDINLSRILLCTPLVLLSFHRCYPKRKNTHDACTQKKTYLRLLSFAFIVEVNEILTSTLTSSSWHD